MLLSDAPRGRALTVRSCRAERPALTRRLAELGIRPGTVLTVLTRTSGRGAILAIGDDRVAVSRSILGCIEAAPAADLVVPHG